MEKTSIKKTLSNKIVRYMLTRYVVYFISFLVSLLCAAKMGPYYYGIWGYILLLISYFSRVNFGIPNATTILMVEKKNDEDAFYRVESSSIFAMGLLGVVVVLIAGYHFFVGFDFKKYPIGSIFYIICVMAILDYFNQLAVNIYRVKKSITEIAIYQSIIPILSFIALFFAQEKTLLYLFVGVYLIGKIIAAFIFIIRGKVGIKRRPDSASVKSLFEKGFFLFLYNGAFYFIIISTRTLISSNYTIVLFGYFTFAYALADAVIKLLDAFSFLIFPKLIDKFNSKDTEQVKSTMGLLRVNYIALSHGIMYIAFLIFPLFTMLLPKYNSALTALYMVALTLIVYTNSFGYSTYLMAQGREKLLSVISVSCLVVNVALGLFFIKVLLLSFDFVILSTMISYLLFSGLCVYFGQKQMGRKPSCLHVLAEVFPLRLLIPFLVALIIVVLRVKWLVFLPIIVFAFLNLNTIKEVVNTFKRVLSNSSIIDISDIPSTK